MPLPTEPAASQRHARPRQMVSCVQHRPAIGPVRGSQDRGRGKLPLLADPSQTRPAANASKTAPRRAPLCVTRAGPWPELPAIARRLLSSQRRRLHQSDGLQSVSCPTTSIQALQGDPEAIASVEVTAFKFPTVSSAGGQASPVGRMRRVAAVNLAPLSVSSGARPAALRSTSPAAPGTTCS